MPFENIIGQEKIIEGLKKALAGNQLAHSYLFEGLEGLGKRRVAFELAKGICCNAEGIRPCNSCSSCVKLEHGNHPDVKWIGGEGSIKIDDIRDLQKDIQVKPYEGNNKIYILCDAEKMTVQAQNALLKTVEEPPYYSTLILLTTNAYSLLPTIVSRCQVLKFSPVPASKIQNFLIKEKGLDIRESKFIAAFSNGAVGKALKLLEDHDFIKRREAVVGLSRTLLNAKTINILEKVNFFNEEKEYIDEILDILISWYRDLMVYKETSNVDFIINCDKIEEIIFQSNQVNLWQIKDIIFIIDKAKNNLRSNVNYQLNIEVMLLNIQEVL